MNFKSKTILIVSAVLVLGGTFALGKNTVPIKTTTLTTVKPVDIKEVIPLQNDGDIIGLNLMPKTTTVHRVPLGVDNVVYFQGEVDDASVDAAINALDALPNTEAKYLVLNSPGGGVFSGYRLISYMETSSTPIYTVCDGLCASMAAYIHQYGKVRLMTPHSILMFHPASGSTNDGQIDQVFQRLTFIKSYIDKLAAYTAYRSSKDFREFQLSIRNELWLDSADATNNKLNDYVVALDLSPVLKASRTTVPVMNKNKKDESFFKLED